MKTLGEAALDLPWIAPSVASLTALARFPLASVWPQVRTDPGIVLLAARLVDAHTDLDVPLRERLVEGNEVENREQGNPAHAAQIERARRENETHQQKCVHRDQPCQISAPQIAECKEGEGDEVRDGSVVPDGNPGPERDRPVLREAAAVEVEPAEEHAQSPRRKARQKIPVEVMQWLPDAGNEKVHC